MTRKKKVVLGSLVILGLVVAVTGALAAFNWEEVSQRLTQAMDTQTEKAQMALFRAGELGSIGARIKSEYSVKPNLTYHTETEGQVLSITCTDYLIPNGVTTEDHARELAVFSLQQTKKVKQIDVIEVVFQAAAQDPEIFRFATVEFVPVAREARD